MVAIPTAVFYDDPEAGRSLVRFAFCKREAVIDEAAARLAAAPAHALGLAAWQTFSQQRDRAAARSGSP